MNANQESQGYQEKLKTSLGMLERRFNDDQEFRKQRVKMEANLSESEIFVVVV